MSSANDTYQHLLVQVQPKSILKKSTSPILIETSTDMNNSIVSPRVFAGKEIVLNHSQVDSSSTSDDEILSRMKTKSKRNYSRPFITNDTLSSSSSSSDNEERKSKRSHQESKTTLGYLSKHQQKDMQLDELMRTYHQQGEIPFPLKENHPQEKMTNKFPRQSNPSSSIKEENHAIVNNDTMSLIESIDTFTLSTKSISPLQILFDVARLKQIDRRTKIDQIRQYVEEQIGISAFLTIYKLIKSSQIPIDFKQKPFCFYENFIPHLCCLIILESEQQQQKKLLNK